VGGEFDAALAAENAGIRLANSLLLSGICCRSHDRLCLAFELPGGIVGSDG